MRIGGRNFYSLNLQYRTLLRSFQRSFLGSEVVQGILHPHQFFLQSVHQGLPLLVPGFDCVHCVQQCEHLLLVLRSAFLGRKQCAHEGVHLVLVFRIVLLGCHHCVNQEVSHLHSLLVRYHL